MFYLVCLLHFLSFCSNFLIFFYFSTRKLNSPCFHLHLFFSFSSMWLFCYPVSSFRSSFSFLSTFYRFFLVLLLFFQSSIFCLHFFNPFCHIFFIPFLFFVTFHFSPNHILFFPCYLFFNIVFYCFVLNCFRFSLSFPHLSLFLFIFRPNTHNIVFRQFDFLLFCFFPLLLIFPHFFFIYPPFSQL